MLSPQIVILSGPDPRAAALAAALRALRWRVWDGAAPGEDADQALLDALRACTLIVVMSAQALRQRAAVLAAIEQWRGDPSGVKVVPIGEVGEVTALTGLKLLQGCPWTSAEAVAQQLSQRAESLGARDNETAPVLLLAHPTEIVERERLHAELSRRRRVQKPVSVAWLDDPQAERLAQQAELVLLVLGCAVSAQALPRVQAVAKLEGCVRVNRRIVLTSDTFASSVDLGAMMTLRGSDPGSEGDALVQKVTETLDAWLQARFEQDGAASLHPWERSSLEARRSTWLRGHHSGLMAITGGSSLVRQNLYVPAKAGPGPWRKNKAGKLILSRQDRGTKPLGKVHDLEKEAAPIWLDELLTHLPLPAVLVEGEAGSGKTVLLQHLASAVSARVLGLSPEEQDHIQEATLSLGAPRQRIPVFLEARRIAARLKGQSAARAIAQLIAEEEFSACGTPPTDAVCQGFEEGRYLLLIDARDEVPSDLQKPLDDALVHLATAHKQIRVVVTSRPAAHTAHRLAAPFVTVPLAPLDDEDRALLVRRWCESFPARAQGPERALGLTAALSELAQRVGELGSDDRSPLDNPLFVTCALLLYELDGQLPDGRADLYDKLVEVLCRSRVPGEASGAETERRELAQLLALTAQQANTVALPVRYANEAVAQARKLTLREAELRINSMAAHTMLWRNDGPDKARVWRPWHRSFQEHLAATELAVQSQTPEATASTLRDILHDPKWRDCVRFLPGAFVAVHSDRGVEWIEALTRQARAEPQPRRRGHLWALVADAVAEERTRCFAGRAGPQGSQAARLAEEIARIYAQEGERYGWEDRLMLLDGLGRMATAAELGWEIPEGEWRVDPRLEDMRVGTSRWVWVEGGEFRLGGDDAAIQAGPGRSEQVPSFFLLNTPVTVQDYRPFVQSGAVSDPRFRLIGAPEAERPLDWARQLMHPNRPVIGVDWWDAVAFVRWADATWRKPEGGGRVTLPSASMWEAAARGKGGDFYPWGNKPEPGREDEARAAHDWEPHYAGPFKHAPSVGAFPLGSHSGLHDLAGTVLEWTSSPYSEDAGMDRVLLSGDNNNVVRPQDRPDAAPRVVRGGSWNDHPRYLRAALRNRWQPDDRFVDLGFRVCTLRENGP